MNSICIIAIFIYQTNIMLIIYHGYNKSDKLCIFDKQFIYRITNINIE